MRGGVVGLLNYPKGRYGIVRENYHKYSSCSGEAVVSSNCLRYFSNNIKKYCENKLIFKNKKNKHNILLYIYIFLLK